MIARKKITDYRVQQVIRIVEQDPKHRVKSLARIVNLSASRLEHLFKEETGGKMSLFILFAGLILFFMGVFMGSQDLQFSSHTAVAGMIVFFLGGFLRTRYS